MIRFFKKKEPKVTKEVVTDSGTYSFEDDTWSCFMGINSLITYIFSNEFPENFNDLETIANEIISKNKDNFIKILTSEDDAYAPYELSSIYITVDEETYELCFTSESWPDAGWYFVLDKNGNVIERWMGD